ncbi:MULTISPECIES: acyltransferase family protein [Akkermansia]|uniref:acyltransferase family protein n=1 Tax=Akkermansia sp. TaxID=1872421 RepID=UPI001C060AE6|nr:acyltransferase family protein [Candidatus Akkermansia timonensis]QWO91175.1 acyltransferase family protein [Candidatus Akkermansia timonensis]
MGTLLFYKWNKINELFTLCLSGADNGIKPRDAWVDIMRVLAMLFIMIQHTPTHHSPVTGMTRAGVFFFFMAAGYFLARNYAAASSPVSWLNWKKAALILCAYVFWIFVSMALFGFPSTLLGWMANMGIGHVPLGVILWFLRDLMVFVLISGILFRIPRPCLAVLCLAALIPFSTESSIRLTFQYGDMACNIIHPRGLGAFALGMLLSPYSLKELKDMVEKAWVYVLIVFPAVFAWEVYHRGHESALFLCMGVLWIASCSLLATRYFRKFSSFCARLGPSIFLVYAAHTLVYRFLIRLGLPEGSYWMWGLAVPAVFLVLSGVYFLLGRICPGVLRYIALKS